MGDCRLLCKDGVTNDGLTSSGDGLAGAENRSTVAKWYGRVKKTYWVVVRTWMRGGFSVVFWLGGVQGFSISGILRGRKCWKIAWRVELELVEFRVDGRGGKMTWDVFSVVNGDRAMS